MICLVYCNPIQSAFWFYNIFILKWILLFFGKNEKGKKLWYGQFQKWLSLMCFSSFTIGKSSPQMLQTKYDFWDKAELKEIIFLRLFRIIPLIMCEYLTEPKSETVNFIIYRGGFSVSDITTIPKTKAESVIAGESDASIECVAESVIALTSVSKVSRSSTLSDSLK